MMKRNFKYQMYPRRKKDESRQTNREKISGNLQRGSH